MKKILILSFFALALSALAAGSFTVSGSLGYAGGVSGGIEASWDCQLFQPAKGRLRPTVDLEYGAGGFQGAFLMRHVFPIGTEGLGLGGGVGLRYDAGVQAYLRGDLEYSLQSALDMPLVAGADVGYAYGFGGAPQEVVAHLKLGYNLTF